MSELPLLGVGLDQAVQECATLAAQLGAHPDPTQERHLLARGGEIALVQRSARAVADLAEAGRLAAEAGDRREALRLGLLVCRALAQAGKTHAALDHYTLFAAQLQDERTLKPDAHLAAAACGEGDPRWHLDAALRLLPSPERDHDRLAAHLQLAALHHDGGGLDDARHHLRAALNLARQHDDPVSACHVSSLLGNLLVEVGLSTEAEPHLARACQLAHDLNDTLSLVAEGTILAGVRLSQQDWAGALAIARLTGPAAAGRENWLGYADAAITQSICLLQQDDLSDAVAVLWGAALTIQTRGTPAARNLVSARLAELRVQYGADDFDPALELARLTVAPD